MCGHGYAWPFDDDEPQEGGMVEVTQDSEIARQVMADLLGLDVAECSAESRGALLIREGIKRYRLTAEQAKDAEIERHLAHIAKEFAINRAREAEIAERDALLRDDHEAFAIIAAASDCEQTRTVAAERRDAIDTLLSKQDTKQGEGK